jgi:hypothetical protein
MKRIVVLLALIASCIFFLVLSCWCGEVVTDPGKVDWSKAENLAKDKPVKIPQKGLDDLKAHPDWGPSEKATNGNRATTDWLGWDLGAETVENQGWVEIDLEEIKWIDALRIWHYYGDGRTYKVAWTVVSTTGVFKGEEKVIFDTRKPGETLAASWIGDVSDDAKVKFKSHAGETYAETSGGRVDLFKSVQARYIRDYCQHTINSHWVEIEAYSLTGSGAVLPSGKLVLTWGKIKNEG